MKRTSCLILSEQAYRDYVAARTEYQERQMAAARRRGKRNSCRMTVRSCWRKGRPTSVISTGAMTRYRGAEISAKLDQMEQVITRIFAVVREHPEVDSGAGETDGLLPSHHEKAFWIPTARLDRQPVAGENISSTKREIESTIDTLNVAFEKFLDGLYEDKAWDISSDISVLNTVLAQDGLKEDVWNRKITLPIVPLCRKPRDAAGQTYRNDINRDRSCQNRTKKGVAMSDELKDFATTPTLTFDVTPQTENASPAASAGTDLSEKAQDPAFSENNLTPEELQMVENFSHQIDISNSQAILQYGVGDTEKNGGFFGNGLK